MDRILGAWRTGDALGDRLLAFLENHDEQRLASRFFAGDGRLGRPGMAVCVGLVRGPVMVYFAQELGEAADGESGFSGDDGRTTIFDYWSVPSLRRCRNGGAWDGAGLSQAERELREFYVRLLGLCSQEKALTEGQVRLVPTGYERVLAWYREHGGRKLFFAANFDRESAHVITADEGPVTVGPMDAIIPVLPS